MSFQETQNGDKIANENNIFRYNISNTSMMPKLAEWHIYGNEQQGRFAIKKPERYTYFLQKLDYNTRNSIFTRHYGTKNYEIKDHLGNVRTVITDVKIPAEPDWSRTPYLFTPYSADVVTQSEYYPFGWEIKLQGAIENNYRYGYNGMERDNDVKGEGNQLDFGEREYDPRIARFTTLDPLKKNFPSQSAYVYAENAPINSIDDGNKRNYMFVYNVYKNQNGSFSVYYDDKASTYQDGKNKGERKYFDDNYMGGYGVYNLYMYEGKGYTELTNLPGKAGELFRKQRENENAIWAMIVLSPITIPAALIAIPEEGAAWGTYAVISYSYTWGSTLLNCYNGGEGNLSTSLPGQVGKMIGGYVAGEKGEQLGELLGYSYDLGSSIYGLSSATNLTKAIQKESLFPINKALNEGKNIINATNNAIGTYQSANDVLDKGQEIRKNYVEIKSGN